MAIITISILISCSSENRDPILKYQSPFDPSYVNAVEEYIKLLSDEKGFRVFEKDREEMRIISKGKEAFFIALYKGEKQFLVISNVGAGDIIFLHLTEHNEIRKSEIADLAEEIRMYLASNFDINLK